MRRFVIRLERTTIEGVQFSDGFIVIHGSVFHGVYVDSIAELERMFAGHLIIFQDGVGEAE